MGTRADDSMGTGTAEKPDAISRSDIFLRVFIGTVFGLIWAAFLSFLAVGMTGLGHGWGGACFAILPSLLIGPMVAIGCLFCQHRVGAVLALLALIAMFAVDVQLLALATSDASGYEVVRSHSGAGLLVWQILWYGAQVMAALTLVYTIATSTVNKFRRQREIEAHLPPPD